MSALGVPVIAAISSRRRLAPAARTTRDELTALESWAEQLIDAGADLIQLRESDWPAGVLTGLARWVTARAAGSTTRVLVNDRADVALAAGAHGVHLPSNGLPTPAVRGLATGWIVGRSVHDGDDVTSAAGVDYFLFGTVFPSVSKPGQQAAGIAALQRAAVASPVPILAIGGITPDRARQCLDVGAAGVAGIGLFLPEGLEAESLGPSRAVGLLRAAMAAS